MAAPTNHYKLGLFVLLGFGLAIAAAVLLGVASTRKETIKYHSYFNESVQGLDLGSPVKFRGVTIGNVSAIEIAPDHRMVDVITDLRAQLGSQGITGVKFIAIDFFDVKSNPPPELPFTAPKDHYIPAAPSMMKNLEDTITKAMDRLPEMVDAVVMIMGRVDRMLAVLEKENIAGKATSTLGHADEVMLTLQATLTRIDKQDLGSKAAGTITDLNKAVNKMNAVLERLDGDKGLLASVKSASDSFGEMGRNGRGTQRDLEATLRDVSEAAEAIRTLAESLDRDPDMLIKGKTKVKASK